MPDARARWALPVASGLLLAAAFPPLDLVVPAFTALVPIAVHLERLGPSSIGVGSAFRAGTISGAVAWGLLLAWIPPVLIGWSWMAVPGYVAATLLLAGLTGVVAALVHRLRFRAHVPLALALPLAWTAGEWTRAHLPGTLAFPWLELGTSLTRHPEWVGIAEVVGTRGVSFWLAAVSGLLAAAWTARGRIRGWLLGGALGLALAVPSWGIRRAAGLDLRPVARVAVVQPGLGLRGRTDRAAASRSVAAVLGKIEPQVAAAGADLVVLPEALLPDTFGVSGGDAGVLFTDFAREVGAPVLFGALAAEERGGVTVTHNSVLLTDGEGLRPFRYDKHHLVPVVERVPLLLLPGVAPGLAGWAPGRGWPVARIAPGVVAGAFVCYESAFGDVARALTLGGATLLVNVTNDAWFGNPPERPRTHALWQHPAHLVVRAIETRRGVVRAANTGFSFLVDPWGRIHDRAAPFGEAVVVGTVVSSTGITPYVRWGDMVGLISLAATILLAAVAGIGSRRRGAG